MAVPDPVRFGGFTQTATFSVASQLGFFNHNDLNVTFLQIPNSTFGYAQILNGGYDFLTGTIDDAVNFRFNSNENLTVLGQLDAGPDLTIASVHNITSILQLKGKSLMVDSPVSGYAYMLRKVLSLYGLNLENGDYIFQTVGSTVLRYQDLLEGHLPNGSTAYATILTYPFTGFANAAELVDVHENPTILARISDFILPVSSTALTVSSASLANTTQRALITRVLASMYAANKFLAEPNNQACSVSAISKELNVTSAVALGEYLAATDAATGETSAGQGIFEVDRQGLLNVIDVRAQFGGFANLPVGFDFVAGISPGVGQLIDYSVRDQVVRENSLADFEPACH